MSQRRHMFPHFHRSRHLLFSSTYSGTLRDTSPSSSRISSEVWVRVPPSQFTRALVSLGTINFRRGRHGIRRKKKEQEKQSQRSACPSRVSTIFAKPWSISRRSWCSRAGRKEHILKAGILRLCSMLLPYCSVESRRSSSIQRWSFIMRTRRVSFRLKRQATHTGAFRAAKEGYHVRIGLPWVVFGEQLTEGFSSGLF